MTITFVSSSTALFVMFLLEHLLSVQSCTPDTPAVTDVISMVNGVEKLFSSQLRVPLVQRNPSEIKRMMAIIF